MAIVVLDGTAVQLKQFSTTTAVTVVRSYMYLRRWTFTRARRVLPRHRKIGSSKREYKRNLHQTYIKLAGSPSYLHNSFFLKLFYNFDILNTMSQVGQPYI